MDRDAQLDRRHQRADFLVRLALLERPQRRAEAVIAGARKVVEREARSVAQELGENVGERGLPRIVAHAADCGRGIEAQTARSDKRRVGTEWVSTCSSRWTPDN